jgi:hypothetical protein
MNQAILLKQLLSNKLTREESELLTVDKVHLPKEFLSPAQATMYLRCGMQYHFRYILGLKKPPSIAMVEGSSNHAAFEGNNKHKIKTGRDRRLRTQQEQFCDTFAVLKKDVPKRLWFGQKEGEIINRGKEFQKRYMRDIAPSVFPESSEFMVELDLGPIHIIGYSDLIAKMNMNPVTLRRSKRPTSQVVMDYKTVGKAKSNREVVDDLALSLYSWSEMYRHAKSRKLLFAGFTCLVKTKEPYVLLQFLEVEIARIAWFRRIMIGVADSITRGAFPICDPSRNPLCSEKYCGYWKQCKGKVWKG